MGSQEANGSKTGARKPTGAWRRTTREHVVWGCLFASLISWLTALAQPTSPPTISDIANLAIYPNLTVTGLVFTVSDADTPADNLTLAGASSNTNLVPAGSITSRTARMNSPRSPPRKPVAIGRSSKTCKTLAISIDLPPAPSYVATARFTESSESLRKTMTRWAAGVVPIQRIMELI